MLQWTAMGAVASPRCVQIRITRNFHQRIIAGAPQPPRSLSLDEFRENLTYFLVSLQGPRTTACQRLILSGLQLPADEGWAQALKDSRAWGLEHTTLHLGSQGRQRLLESPLRREIDAVVLPIASVQDVSDLAALRHARTSQGRPLELTAVLLLCQQTLGMIDGLVQGLLKARPHKVVFTWPFPPASPPPHVQRLPQALEAPMASLTQAGIPFQMKGLPACQMPAQREHFSRSRNRWYVDAAHQKEAALLFFPDVIRFTKLDDCRFCSLTHQCDGVVEKWLRDKRLHKLEPFDDSIPCEG